MGISDKLKSNEEISKESYYAQFVNTFKPAADLKKPLLKELKSFGDILPNELLNLWRRYGFGNYGDGIIKVINPVEYMNNLYEWLGNGGVLKIPILMTGFGDIFYYRKLDNNVEDVCLLNIHYRNCIVCSYSIQDFFNSYIINEDIYEELLKKGIFEEAYASKGSLKESEIYLFSPALALGGHESLESIDKGNARIHQSILYQLAL